MGHTIGLKLLQRLLGFLKFPKSTKTWEGTSKQLLLNHLRKQYDEGYRFFIINEKCIGFSKILFLHGIVLLLIPEERKKDLYMVVQISEADFWDVYENKLKSDHGGGTGIACAIRMSDYAFIEKGTVLQTHAPIKETLESFVPSKALATLISAQKTAE